jgi:protein-tyrosine phosphatase
MLTELLEDKLYQSGFPDFGEIVNKNIKLVIYLGKTAINLPDSIEPEQDFSYIWWPFTDGPMPDIRILEGLADIAAGFLKKEEKVLISCAAGVNRSSLLACLIMMKFLKVDAQEAVEEIRKKNPFALFNENFYSWLTQKQKKIM